MLSDSERRTLDATAALLAHDDPHLAAQLGQHRIVPPRHRERERPAPGRRWRVNPAVWPPVLAVVLCLGLLFLPGLLVGRGRAADLPAPAPTSAQVVGDAPASR